MARIKISRKKLLHEPDEFLSLSQKVWFWVHDHPGRAAAIAGGVVAAVVIAIGGRALVLSNHAARVQEVARAIERYTAPQEGDTAPDISVELSDLTKKYAGDPEGLLARYFLGTYLAGRGEQARAGEHLAQVGKNAPAGSELGVFSRVARGYLALTQGESDRALEVFREVLEEKGAAVPRSQLQIEIGAILEKKGLPAEARRVYQEIAQAFPDSSWGTKAQERMRFLDDQLKSAS